MSEYLSSTRNYLLNRDDVGKPRPTTRRLPSMDFAYGHPPNKDPEGVREGNLSQSILLDHLSSSHWNLEVSLSFTDRQPRSRFHQIK